jgi:mRNA interferase RelE/StbE
VFEIRILPAAQKSLIKLSRADRRLVLAIDNAIRALAENPRPAGCKQLAGSKEPPLYRIRVGNYRIIYEVHDDVVLVSVIHVGHRKDIYRVLK